MINTEPVKHFGLERYRKSTFGSTANTAFYVDSTADRVYFTADTEGLRLVSTADTVHFTADTEGLPLVCTADKVIIEWTVNTHLQLF